MAERRTVNKGRKVETGVGRGLKHIAVVPELVCRQVQLLGRVEPLQLPGNGGLPKTDSP